MDGQKFCPHCNFYVHKSTYYNHKSLYGSDEPWGSKFSLKRKRVAESKIQQRTNEESAQNENDTDMRVEQKSSVRNVCTAQYQQRVISDTFDIYSDNESETELKDTISDRLFEIWDSVEYDEIERNLGTNPSKSAVSQVSEAVALVNWFVLFISMWAAYCNISNNAVELLLHFIKAFLQVCGYFAPIMGIIATIFPGSLYSLFKIQGTVVDDFVRYVVCPRCFCVYDYQDSYTVINGTKTSKKCSYIKFPKHPQRSKREPCDETLLKEIQVKGNKTILYPRKVYCYHGIITSLKAMLERPNFEENCEQWHNRSSIPGTLRDVYDGRIWKKFLTYVDESGSERPFLCEPHNLGFMLNLDWFQPYKHSPYSVGVLYLVIMNLPREIRFKEENIICIGIIPGPKEPDGESLNFFLEPMVDELVILWKEGIQHNSKKYHGALLACACDLPAGRKLCGLLSFAARVGCSKCTKEFKTEKFGKKSNYGGFQNLFPRRNYNHIKSEAKKARKAKTQTEKSNIERSIGARWSELMRLPYFNPVDMLIIDPMHGLYLGTAKHMLKERWPNHCGFQDSAMREIQCLVDNTHLPTDVGRIPYKIASCFSNFTSDQFKNWVLYFSAFTMTKHLSESAYQVWLHFVEDCGLYNRPVLTLKQVSKAHENMMKFNRQFESWLGSSEYTTPNQHFHTHLVDCVLDFGPFYGFWLYSFERYNGILGAYHQNQKAVEMQIMRKFLRNQSVKHLEIPHEYQEELKNTLSFIDKKTTSSTILKDQTIPISRMQLLLRISNESLLTVMPEISIFGDMSLIKINGESVCDFVENSSQKQNLITSLKTFLSDIKENDISGSFQKFHSLEYLGEIYSSINVNNGRNCHVVVNSWVGQDCNINQTDNRDRPGEILHFLKMFLPVQNTKMCVILAFIRWFQSHPARNLFETELASVWCKSLYEIDGPASFVPVQKFKHKFVSGFIKHEGESVRVVMPKIPKHYW